MPWEPRESHAGGSNGSGMHKGRLEELDKGGSAKDLHGAAAAKGTTSGERML